MQLTIDKSRGEILVCIKKKKIIVSSFKIVFLYLACHNTNCILNICRFCSQSDLRKIKGLH